MYCSKNNTGIFTPEIIGLKKEQVVDEILMTHHVQNGCTMGISISGLIIIFFILIAGLTNEIKS